MKIVKLKTWRKCPKCKEGRLYLSYEEIKHGFKVIYECNKCGYTEKFIQGVLT